MRSVFLTAAAVAIGMALSGCQTNQTEYPVQTPFTGATYLYLSHAGGDDVAVYRVDPASGELTAQGSVIVGKSAGPIAVSPDHRYLYVALREAGGVAAMRINGSNGMPSTMEAVKLQGRAAYLETDRQGRWLLAAYFGDNKVSVNRITKIGTVDPNEVLVMGMDKNPHSIRTDPSNKFVFVPNTGADVIHQLQLDTTRGTMVHNSAARVPTDDTAGPRHFDFHPNERWVYVVNEKSSSVTAYHLDRAGGKLEAFQTVATLPEDFEKKNTCADIHVSPNGKFVYASNRGHDSIAAFSVDAVTGKLTSIGTFGTETRPRSFAIDPSGRFLYAAGVGSDRLAGYKIRKDGTLERLYTYETGSKPFWVSVIRLP